jgi:hypothetical protein
MDPSIASMLGIGFLIALGLSAYEVRASLRPPVCAECPHCRAMARAKAQEQAELQDWYAHRWNLNDRDDEPRNRR